MSILSYVLRRRRPPAWLWPLVIFDVVMRAIATRQALQNGHRRWALALGLVNSMGILPIVYLRFYQGQQDSSAAEPGWD